MWAFVLLGQFCPPVHPPPRSPASYFQADVHRLSTAHTGTTPVIGAGANVYGTSGVVGLTQRGLRAHHPPSLPPQGSRAMPCPEGPTRDGTWARLTGHVARRDLDNLPLATPTPAPKFLSSSSRLFLSPLSLPHPQPLEALDSPEPLSTGLTLQSPLAPQLQTHPVPRPGDSASSSFLVGRGSLGSSQPQEVI